MLFCLQAIEFLSKLIDGGKALKWGSELLGLTSLQRLNPGQQINDEIVNMVVATIANKQTAIWTTSSFFFSQLFDCYSGRKEWKRIHKISSKVSAFPSPIVLCTA